MLLHSGLDGESARDPRVEPARDVRLFAKLVGGDAREGLHVRGAVVSDVTRRYKIVRTVSLELEVNMSSSLVTALSSRYSDAYSVARTIDGFGDTIKAIGFVIGGFLAIVSVVMANDKGAFGLIIVVLGVAAGGTIATVLFLLGTLASAQGQILKATLDTAVNSSQFLSDPDRARIMSLPYAATNEWPCRCGQRNPAGAVACLDCGVGYGAA